MQCNANSLPHGHLRLMGKLQMQKIGRTNFKLTLLHLVLFREYYLKTHTHTEGEYGCGNGVLYYNLTTLVHLTGFPFPSSLVCFWLGFGSSIFSRTLCLQEVWIAEKSPGL